MMAGQIKNIKTQYLRAFLIFLVILIHSLTNSNNSGERFMIISIRNICNVAVPTFFYLSGYYFNKIKYYKSPKNYIMGKIKRLIIPLIIWNVIYFVIMSHFNLKSLLTFNTAPQLYYICVLLQLILLTPLLLKSKKLNYIFIVINILHLLLYRYLWMIKDINLGLHYYFFSAWVIYYLLGLNNDKLPKIKKTFFVFLIVLEIIYNFSIISKIGFEYTLSQINLFNLLVSISFIMCINQYISTYKIAKKFRHIEEIGDLSFGIFLIHMLVLKTIKFIMCIFLKESLLFMLINAILTFIISYLIIKVLIYLNKKTINSKFINYVLGV